MSIFENAINIGYPRRVPVIDDKYKGLYIAIPLDKVDVKTLPPRNWFNDPDLNSLYLLFGLKSQAYSYQPGSGIINKAYKVHLVEDQAAFEAMVLARELNADLRELFDGKSDE